MFVYFSTVLAIVEVYKIGYNLEMESEELREMVERTYELTRKNNKMIRRMRRASFFGSLIKLILWGGMIFVSVWSYYQYLQPMMGTLTQSMEQLQKMKETVGNIQGIKMPDVSGLKNVQDNLPDKMPDGFMDALNMIRGAKTGQ